MERLEEAIKKVLTFLREIPLSTITVEYYQRRCLDVRAFCESEGIEVFDGKAAQLFTSVQKARHDAGEFAINLFRQLRKTASLLTTCVQGEELVWGRSNYGKKMSESFEGVLSTYADYIGQTLASRTCKGLKSMARRFLLFAESRGKCSLRELHEEDLKQFIQHRSKEYPKSMKHIVGGLKKFFGYLNSMGFACIDADRYLVRTAPRHVRLLPCFTDDEAAMILAAADRSTSLGKRDYAILKIALGVGLRCVDIFALKLTDIDWERNTINILQSKTNTYGQLPLLPDVGNAIAEYILEARPESPSLYIFLRCRMPHDRLFATGNDLIRRSMAKAGIDRDVGDGKSFHALRRTVGTRLVRAKVPIPTVAQLLIHSSIDSSKRYISLDDESLRVCCLDISEYATTKEGLS